MARKKARPKPFPKTWICAGLLATCCLVSVLMSFTSLAQSLERLWHGPPERLLQQKAQEMAERLDLSYDAPVERMLDNIKDLLIEDMRSFSTRTCQTTQGFDQAKKVLRERVLKNLPPLVAERLVEAALQPESDTAEFLKDSTSPSQTSGTAAYYEAWIQTRYDSRTDQYSTCASVAGVTFAASEVLAGEKQETHTVQRGTEPCHCSSMPWGGCQKCPVMVTEVTRTPIFKRHALTLSQSEQLMQYMEFVCLRMAAELEPAGFVPQLDS